MSLAGLKQDVTSFIRYSNYIFNNNTSWYVHTYCIRDQQDKNKIKRTVMYFTNGFIISLKILVNSDFRPTISEIVLLEAALNQLKFTSCFTF